MAASIESRVPFLDHKLVEFAATLPDEWKLSRLDDQADPARGDEGRAAARRSSTGRRWASRCRSRDWTARRVERRRARRAARSRARASAASSIRRRSSGCSRDHAAGRTDGGDRIWSLLNLELWYRTFIDGEGVQTLPTPRRSPAATPLLQGDRMRILWLKSDLLLPLDKGGKLRTWHLMRHLARAPRDHLSVVRGARRSRRPTSRACARSRARVETIPRTRAGRRARCASTPTPRGTSSIRCRTPSRKYRSARVTARRLDALLDEQRFDLDRLRLPAAGGQPAGAAALPGDALHAQRRGGDLAAARGDRRRNPVAQAAVRRSSGAGCCASRRGRSRASIGVLAVSDADRETFARLYPGACAAPVHVVPTGVDTDVLRARPPREPRSRGAHWSSPARWTGCRTKTRCIYFCREILPLIRARGAGRRRSSIVGRAPTPAVRRLADEPGVEVTGRVDDVRPYMRDGGGLRRAAAHRRRHAAEDLRGDGDGQGGGVDDGRRRRAAGHRRRARRARRRAARASRARSCACMRDTGRAARSSRRPRAQLVVERYDWSAVAGDFEEALTRFAPIDDGSAASGTSAARPRRR